MNTRQVLTEKEVSAEYGFSVAWLRKMRRLRRGPIYLKITKLVKYQRDDIESFLLDHMVATSDGGKKEGS